MHCEGSHSPLYIHRSSPRSPEALQKRPARGNGAMRRANPACASDALSYDPDRGCIAADAAARAAPALGSGGGTRGVGKP